MLKGGERLADFEYPDEVWYYWQFADRFGWTPEQVDSLSATQADWFLAISNTVQEVKIERAEEAGA